jgi:hypothetical protein
MPFIVEVEFVCVASGMQSCFVSVKSSQEEEGEKRKCRIKYEARG